VPESSTKLKINPVYVSAHYNLGIPLKNKEG